MAMRNKHMVWMVLLCIALIAAGCSSSNNTDNGNQGAGGQTAPSSPSAETPAPEASSEPVVLSAFAAPGPNVENLETNWFTQHVEEMLNIRFDWVIAPNQGAEERKQLLLASGDYPAVFVHGGFTKEEQMTYGQQGVLIPLNALIEEHAPNIKQRFAEISYLEPGVTAPDGNIYALPSINENYHGSRGQKMWINQRWLDELQLDMPRTTEQFYKVLKAFKERDPNGNNKQDEVPLSGAVGTWHANIDAFLMNAFVFNDNDRYFVMESGKLSFAPVQEGWKQGLAYMNRLYKDGLIDPSAFTQKLEGLNQLGNNAGEAILGAFSAGHVGMATSVSEGEDRHKDYVVLPPLQGPDGVQLTHYSPGAVGNSIFAITNKATQEQAIAAIKLADYFYTAEGTLFAVNGPKGEMWDTAAADEIGLWGEPAAYTSKPRADELDVQNFHWAQMGPTLRTAEWRASWATAQDPLDVSGYELRLAQATKLYEPFDQKESYPAGVFISPEHAEEISHLYTSIDRHVETSMLQFITGNKDIDKEWDSYVAGFERLNLDRYLQIYQETYDNLQ